MSTTTTRTTTRTAASMSARLMPPALGQEAAQFVAPSLKILLGVEHLGAVEILTVHDPKLDICGAIGLMSSTITELTANCGERGAGYG